MRNLKDILNKITGKKVHSVKVTIISPWDSSRNRLSFDLEIESAYLTEIVTINFFISNRLVNDEVDEEEFEWLFSKEKFQEELKEDTYDAFKISMFGVGIRDFEITFTEK
jgi:hypothetical protein